MIHECAEYSCGVVRISHLYHDTHLVVYRDYASLLVGVPLLHVWEWGHIVVTQPLTVQNK